MGGDVGVESLVDRGSKFWVDLPFQLPETGAIHSAPEGIEVSRSRYSGTILVAEDNPVSQRLAVLLLKRYGFDVDVAANGLEALQKWRDGTYDAVFLDCHMPVQDGFDTARAMRGEERGARVPIIAMTAAALLEDRQSCLAAGMDDFVSKPVEVDRLERVLAKWLQPLPVPPEDLGA
jgi:CheY-like chemotaxis protein